MVVSGRQLAWATVGVVCLGGLAWFYRAGPFDCVMVLRLGVLDMTGCPWRHTVWQVLFQWS